MIELKGVSKQYLYGAKVLNVLDLTINDGEFISVIGDSLSGKTTLLKVIAGVTECEGEVIINGKKTSSKTDDVIMLFSDLALDKYKSIKKNIALPLELRKVDKNEINNKIEWGSSKLGLISVLNTKAYKASPLERALAAFARLIIRESKVLIIDDPTCALNVNEKAEYLKITEPILYELKKQGKTIIYSSSDPVEATALSDRVIVLHDGKVKQIDTLDEIYNNPSNIWAAQALDPDYNIFRARLGLKDGKKILDFNVDDIDMVLPAESLTRGVIDKYITREVLVCVHPEDFLLEDEIEKLNLDKTKIEDEVIFQKRVGNKIRKYTKGGFNIDSNGISDKVFIVPNIDKAILFDKENENSIFKMVR